MTKCKRKLLPAEPYEIDALESWFSDLSAEGLHVQKANALFATFIEGEKKRLLFRMEPKQDAIFPALDESQAEERNAQHREKGWSFVCGLNRFYVYAAEEGTADYFATPEEEGAYYPDNLKGNKFFNSIYAELLVIVVLIAAYIFVLHRQTTYDWVEGFANPFCNPLILVLPYLPDSATAVPSSCKALLRQASRTISRPIGRHPTCGGSIGCIRSGCSG